MNQIEKFIFKENNKFKLNPKLIKNLIEILILKKLHSEIITTEN